MPGEWLTRLRSNCLEVMSCHVIYVSLCQQQTFMPVLSADANRLTCTALSTTEDPIGNNKSSL